MSLPPVGTKVWYWKLPAVSKGIGCPDAVTSAALTLSDVLPRMTPCLPWCWRWQWLSVGFGCH